MRRIVLAPALAALLFAAAPAHADSEQDRAREAVESGQVKPLKQILKAVRKDYKGEVLDAKLLERGGGWIYRIKVLSKDGQVFDIGVDGQSGQIVDVQGGG